MDSFTEETNKAAESLVDVRDRAKDLNDSLQVLSKDGFENLSKTVLKAAQQSKNGPARRAESDIVESEVGKTLNKEMTNILRGLFGGGKAGGGINPSGGGDGITVIINNNAGAYVAARQSTDMFNQKQLEITIDQMVASALMGGRQTSGVMRTLFGLAPGLAGR